MPMAQMMIRTHDSTHETGLVKKETMDAGIQTDDSLATNDS
jgi:hypothetical protein